MSHLYLPPSFQARAGSTHGYDVIDPGRISAELGGEDDAVDLALAEHLDFVALFRGILVRAAEQQSEAARAGHRLEAGDSLTISAARLRCCASRITVISAAAATSAKPTLWNRTETYALPGVSSC